MYKGQLVFATNNPNKIIEVRHLLPKQISLLSLSDINCFDELPETHETLEENALEKAQYIFEHFEVDCFAEDTGLEVLALNGAPGVYSARYAGETKSADENIDLLLKNMVNAIDRSAQFRTIVSLIIKGKIFQFEGKVTGKITKSKQGNSGFGYDPVFIPDGKEQSFAEMDLDEKSEISHRKKAIEQLIKFLLHNYQ